MDEIAHCPECGGASPGKSCPELFHDLLALESLSQELQALHFFNVATFNMQHPSPYQPGAFAIMRQGFMDALDHGWDPGAIRREMGRRLSGFDSAAKVIKLEGEREIVPRAWNVTIHDVVVQGDPAATAERVRAWAKAVREELT